MPTHLTIVLCAPNGVHLQFFGGQTLSQDTVNHRVKSNDVRLKFIPENLDISVDG